MLRIRLQRRGKRSHATYRVVVAEGSAPIQGRLIADLGYYNPHTDEFSVDKQATAHWLAQGVKPSATVHNLLVTHQLLQADKVRSWRPKTRTTPEPPPATQPAADKGKEADKTKKENQEAPASSATNDQETQPKQDEVAAGKRQEQPTQVAQGGKSSQESTEHGEKRQPE
jgi:small subunit ribosomal protein S16